MLLVRMFAAINVQICLLWPCYLLMQMCECGFAWWGTMQQSKRVFRLYIWRNQGSVCIVDAVAIKGLDGWEPGY